MAIAYKNSVPSLDEIIKKVAPKNFLRDPLGLFSGYRAYLVFSHLDGLSDETLATLNLKRQDIPAIAAKQVTDSVKVA